MNTAVRTVLRGFWLVGVAALVVSVAGAGWALYSRASDGATRGTPTPAASVDTGRVLGVVVGYVDVRHGTRWLYPGQQGRVEQVLVEENEQVQAGQVLLSVDKEPAELLVRLARADVASAEAELEKARKGPEQQKLQEAQLQQAIIAARSDVKRAEEELARVEALWKAKQSGDREGHEVNALKAQVEKAKAGVQAMQDKLAEAKLNDPQLDIRRAQANVAAKKARLDEALKGLKECDLRAPGAGTILRVLTGKGDLLGPNPRQPAIVFCPDEPRIIRAELDQESASRVHLRQRATIEDDTRTGEEWQGIVEQIAGSYLQRRSTLPDPFTLSDTRILECILKIEPGKQPPRFGQRVRVKLRDEKAP
jgi:multidrug resistance efflux pump